MFICNFNLEEKVFFIFINKEKMKFPKFLSQFDSRGPHNFQNNRCIHCGGDANKLGNLYNCSGNPKW